MCQPYIESATALSDMHYKNYSYSRRGTNENKMKIRRWTVLWTIIRKARNHCQNVDHCLG